MWLLIECYLGSVLQFRVVKVHWLSFISSYFYKWEIRSPSGLPFFKKPLSSLCSSLWPTADIDPHSNLLPRPDLRHFCDLPRPLLQVLNKGRKRHIGYQWMEKINCYLKMSRLMFKTLGSLQIIFELFVYSVQQLIHGKKFGVSLTEKDLQLAIDLKCYVTSTLYEPNQPPLWIDT